MNLQNSQMQSLAASLKEARADLDSLYIKLGSKILQGEETKTANGELDETISLADWKKLMQEREAAAASVITIEDSLNRFHALKKTEKHLSRSLADAKKKMRSAGLRFIAAFWDEYDPEQFPSFEPVYNACKLERQACLDLEERQRSVRDGVEAGKPLSKMMAQFRSAGISAQLYYRKTRFEQSAGDALETLAVSSGASNLEEELKAAEIGQHCENFKPFMDAAREFLSVLERIKKCDCEKQSVNAALDVEGALESPSRRLDALRHDIKEKDAAIDNICRARGMDYATLFFDETGKPIEESEDAASNEFSDELLEIARLLSEVEKIERQIEILKTEIKIKNLDKSIAVHNAEIDSINKKIDSMKARVESIEKAIGDIYSEKAGLRSYLEKISAVEDSEYKSATSQDSSKAAEDAEIAGEG